MVRCWPVWTTATSNSSERRLSSWITTAILMASGLVPSTAMALHFISTHLWTNCVPAHLVPGVVLTLVAIGRGPVGRKWLNPQVLTPTHGQLDLRGEVT